MELRPRQKRIAPYNEQTFRLLRPVKLKRDEGRVFPVEIIK